MRIWLNEEPDVMELIGILCGMLFWGPVIFLWFVYMRKGKPSKPVRYIGSGVLFTIVSALVILTLNGFYVDEQESRIIHAAADGDVAQVESLLKSGADINHVEENLDWTPLMFASFNGNTDVVAALVRHHPNLDYRNRGGKTALRFAIENDHPAIVRLLKAAGAKE
jgi:hypothetical protein